MGAWPCGLAHRVANGSVARLEYFFQNVASIAKPRVSSQVTGVKWGRLGEEIPLRLLVLKIDSYAVFEFLEGALRMVNIF